jgi:hypothetical protein
MLQLAEETVKLFDATIADMGMSINYSPDGQDPISSIFEYIETTHISLWETAFFLEFSMEKGIHKNKKVEDQLNFKQAMRRVLFRYFKFVLFPFKALARTPAFFAAYLDKDSEDCMFTDAILKAWDPVHLPTCGWYLDCPLKRPPSSEVSLRESLEPTLKGKIASTPNPQAKESVKKGGKRKKPTPEAKKSTPEAKSEDVVVDLDALTEDLEASTVNIASPIMKKDEPIAKRIKPTPLPQPQSVPSSNVSTFELLAQLKSMAFTPPSTSAWSTSSELILNDSFVRMAKERQQTRVWPKCYDDMVAFLTKVLIPIPISLYYHSFPSLSLYSFLSIVLHIFISFHSIMYLQLCEGRDIFFRGQLEKKPTVDLIIVEYPNGLRVPSVSDPPTQIPH